MFFTKSVIHSCSICPFLSQSFVNNSIVSQAQQLNTVPYACSHVDVQAAKVGTQPEHWDVIHVYDVLLMSNGGPQFPDGLFYDSNIGGLPTPDASARIFLAGRTNRVLAAGKEALPNLCTSNGQNALVMTLQNDYQKYKDQLKEYLTRNCVAINRAINSRAGFAKLTLEGSKAIINAMPKAARFVPDKKTLAAITDLVISYFFDSVNGNFVFV